MQYDSRLIGAWLGENATKGIALNGNGNGYIFSKGQENLPHRGVSIKWNTQNDREVSIVYFDEEGNKSVITYGYGLNKDLTSLTLDRDLLFGIGRSLKRL